ncbi:hypothetical protein QYM36_016253 [Artemia franciscana]|uniref:Uncharacterized protein n=1 Tax=Artemia franciscana TaxID=6661 RepID=A0AA88HIV6_ARTSF|nr:hypothetical protein QYM36_016253 [Artemia franciscana]
MQKLVIFIFVAILAAAFCSADEKVAEPTQDLSSSESFYGYYGHGYGYPGRSYVYTSPFGYSPYAYRYGGYYPIHY